MFNPKSNIMKTNLRTLLLIPFFALLMFTSCQDEVIDITDPNETETLVAESTLTSLISATSTMDGSADNIIDGTSCISVKLPVIVKVRGVEIRIDSKLDYIKIRRLYDELEDDIDRLDIIFPITIITSDHEEITIESTEQLTELIAECKGDDEEEKDIRCVDFQFPIAFSTFDRDFQIIETVEIENDRQLYRFMKRVKNSEVFASLNFPVNMVLKDGTVLIADNNEQLKRIIEEAKDNCEEDNDFSKERLENYLKRCPWIVNEFKRDNQDNTQEFSQYAINFKQDSIVTMRSRNGDILTGTWGLRSTRRGVLLKMAFDNLADFTLEWLLYDFEDGKIKIYEVGGNRILLKRNCDVVVDITKERVKNFLKECFWRVDTLRVNNTFKQKEYIGTPLKFFDNDVVKIRVEGELVEGTYNIGLINAGVTLQITLNDRPDLKLEWVIKFLQEDLIRLTNNNNSFILRRHCFDVDEDLIYVDRTLIEGEWEVATYQVDGENKPEEFFMYTLDFMITGRVKVTDPNNGVFRGSWLSYRKDGLNLGLFFGNNAPFDDLNHRWKVKEITPNRIELKDLNANGGIERILVLEKKA